MTSAQTDLLIHMLGYNGEETLGEYFHDAVSEYGYEVSVVNAVIRLFNSRYDTNISPVPQAEVEE